MVVSPRYGAFPLPIADSSFTLRRRNRRKKDPEMMPTAEELQQELERLRRENEALKKTSSRGLSLKVSEKGALSVYGLGRFPVTLYKEQWVKLLDAADDIRAFIQANNGALKAKVGRDGGE
jgi:hypothetical protein